MSNMGSGSSGPRDRVVIHLEQVLRLARGEEVDEPVRIGFESSDQMLQAARMIYQSRRKRENYFGMLACEFGEPCWDILLDLFIADREGREISVSSASIAAAVPPTTALRWLVAMEERDLIIRSQDPHDNRRRFVAITDKARRAMEGYLAAEVLPRSA